MTIEVHMANIVDYSVVLERLTAGGLRCNYPNSGAFGFPPSAKLFIRGWIGSPDASIRATMQANVRMIPAPVEANLAAAALRIVREILPGPVWAMPASHWHFEMHDGSRDWMPDLLAEIKVDPTQLENRADGSAIEFPVDEGDLLRRFLESLLTNLRVSDFVLAFPGRAALCAVHHHKQLWWTTTDAAIVNRLDEILKS